MYERNPTTGVFKVTPSVCESCARKRKSDFIQTNIYVNKILHEPVDAANASQKFVIDVPVLESSAASGSRRSKRNKGQQVTQFQVQKDDLLMNLKFRLFESLDIPPSRQRLFLRGKELLDNEVRFGDLEIYRNAILDLLERDEDDSMELVPNSKKIERGFEGTGLVSSKQSGEDSSSSSPKESFADVGRESPLLVSAIADLTKVFLNCPACSIENDPHAVLCVACAAVLDPPPSSMKSERSPDSADMEVDVGEERLDPLLVIQKSRKQRPRTRLTPATSESQASTSTPAFSRPTRSSREVRTQDPDPTPPGPPPKRRRRQGEEPANQDETEVLDVGMEEKDEKRKKEADDESGEVEVEIAQEHLENEKDPKIEEEAVKDSGPVDDKKEEIKQEEIPKEEIQKEISKEEIQKEEIQKEEIQGKDTTLGKETRKEELEEGLQEDEQPGGIPVVELSHPMEEPSIDVELEEEEPAGQHPVVTFPQQEPPLTQQKGQAGGGRRGRPSKTEKMVVIEPPKVRSRKTVDIPRLQTRGEKRRLLEETPPEPEQRRTRARKN